MKDLKASHLFFSEVLKEDINVKVYFPKIIVNYYEFNFLQRPMIGMVCDNDPNNINHS